MLWLIPLRKQVIPHLGRAAGSWLGVTEVSWCLRWVPGPQVEAPPLAPPYTRRRTGTGCTASSESWPSCWTSPHSTVTTTPSTSYFYSPEEEEKNSSSNQHKNRQEAATNQLKTKMFIKMWATCFFVKSLVFINNQYELKLNLNV